VNYLLDTNVCVGLLRGRSEKFKLRLMSLKENDASVCSIVKAELFFGALRSQKPAENLAHTRLFLSTFNSFPFDDAAASLSADIRAKLTRTGSIIGPHDLQIAAIALANDLTLVTHNSSEFSRIDGLRMEDWEV